MDLGLYLITASVLLGSTISKVISKFLIYQKGISLFSSSTFNIPFFSDTLAGNKSFDILEFILMIIISIAVFLIFNRIIKSRTNNLHNKIIGLLTILPALIISTFVFFASYSGIQILLLILLIYTLIVLITSHLPVNIKSIHDSESAIYTGAIVGFYLFVLSNNVFSFPAASIILLILSPICFYIFLPKLKILESPAFMLMAFGVLFPFNRLLLLVTGLVTILLVIICQRYLQSKIYKLFQKLLPTVVFFLIIYNPLFYLGTFDSVEEGFWAAWLKRLIDGQVIYKDFAAYHPPLLILGLFGFTKIFGLSLYYLRLYFHLLQILGLGIIFVAISKITKNKWVLYGIFSLVLIYSSLQVRNNMEIRLATGLAPLILIFLNNLKPSKIVGIGTGIMLGVALLTSLDTGIASLGGILTIFVLSIRSKDIKTKIWNFLIGIIIVLTPFLLYLLKNSSLSKFIEYIIFYPKTFAQGFQNLAIDRPGFSPMVEWLKIHYFASTSGIVWYICEFIIAVTLLLLIYKWIGKEFGKTEVFISGILAMSLILARSALGRSDFYHINFVWIVCLILLAWIFDHLITISKVGVAIIFIVTLLFIRTDSLDAFLTNQSIKYQSFAKLPGQYPQYDLPRGNIVGWTDFNAKDYIALNNYIDQETSRGDSIFVFPQIPEIYFLSDRRNATSFDTPTAFFIKDYQNLMVNQLNNNHPKLIVYNSKLSVGGISASTLEVVNKYILDNYEVADTFGDNQILTRK